MKTQTEDSDLEEEVLVRQMKNGDKSSFDLLYDKYKNIALRTAYLITGNLSDSEDVVQDTFVKVWLHCRELKNEGGFKAWMLQILVRTAYRLCKKKNKELPDDETVLLIGQKTASSSLEQVLAKEQAELIAESIGNLPVKQRTVVILFYYQECSVSEIAAICGCLEGTVKSRLHTARVKLKKMLSENGDGADNVFPRGQAEKTV
jgi:RNA polymerase sigma-70 factor (ECF subfamily)